MRYQRHCLIYIYVSICVAWSSVTVAVSGTPNAEYSVRESDKMRAAPDQKPKATDLYNETYRPQFHFTTKKNWLADPDGLVYYKGEYHLFYLTNPTGSEPATACHWGHAVSPDMVHWQELPVAIYPDDGRHVWSGSAVVDWNNTSGLQTGPENVLVILYTSPHSGQYMAYSNDRARTWKKYSRNPVLPVTQTGTWDDRDAKAFWHKPSQKWVITLSESPKGKERISFYSSPDLKSWQHLSSLHGYDVDCPEIFELPVDANPKRKKWVLLYASARPFCSKYVIGEFDGISFTRESGPHLVDWGNNMYASQTWSDIPETDSRRVHIAWMFNGEYPGMPFNQQMSFPCELTLRSFSEGIRMCRRPVNEIKNIHSKQYSWKNKTLSPGDNPLSGIYGDLFDIRAEIVLPDAGEFGIKVRGETVKYVVKDKKLSCLGKSAQLYPVSNRIKLQILVDRASLEVFGNDGKVSMTSCFTPEQADTSLAIYTTGGTVRIFSLDVYELRSIWHEKAQAGASKANPSTMPPGD